MRYCTPRHIRTHSSFANQNCSGLWVDAPVCASTANSGRCWKEGGEGGSGAPAAAYHVYFHALIGASVCCHSDNASPLGIRVWWICLLTLDLQAVGMRNLGLLGQTTYEKRLLLPESWENVRLSAHGTRLCTTAASMYLLCICQRRIAVSMARCPDGSQPVNKPASRPYLVLCDSRPRVKPTRGESAGGPTEPYGYLLVRFDDSTAGPYEELYPPMGNSTSV